MRKVSPLVAVIMGVLLFHVLPDRTWGVSDPFYQGRTIRIIAGFTPGGGVDLRSRIFARHLSKWIPGKPLIIVQNMPGAGGLLAANFAFSAAKPDGLTLLHFPVSTVMHAFLAPERVRYQIREVPVIWVQPATWLTIANPKTSNVKSAKDLLRPSVRLAVGATSATSTRSLRPKLAMELFGAEHTWVTGYGGSASLLAALDRGEVHLYEEPLAGFSRILEPRAKEGSVAVLWQTGVIAADGSFQRSPSIPEIPTLEEVLPADKRRGPAWEAYKALAVTNAFEYSVGLAPGVVPDRVEILSQAFKAMTHDPSFRQEYEKAMETSADAYVGSEAQRVMRSGIRLLEESRSGIRYVQELKK